MDEKLSTQAPRVMAAARNAQPQTPRADAKSAPSDAGGSSGSGSRDSASQTRGENLASASSTPPLDSGARNGSFTEVLEASRAELDQLLEETQKLHERSWNIIRTLLEDSQVKASRAVDACLERFEIEIRERVNSEIAMTLQNLDIEAGARLAARLDQALAAAKQHQQSIEQDLAMAVAENRKQLDQLSSGAAQAVQQCEQSLVEGLKKEAAEQLDVLEKKASQIIDTVQNLGDNLGNELKHRTDEAFQVFQSRVDQVWQEIVERVERRIAETAANCTAEMAKQARQVVDREMSEFLSQALRRFDRSSDEQSSRNS